MINKNLWKYLSAVLLVSLMVLSAFTVSMNYNNSESFEEQYLKRFDERFESEASLGSPYETEKTCSYIINKVGTYYYALNGTTGRLQFYSTNASYIINTAITNSNEGSIYLTPANYTITSSILSHGKNNIKLYSDGAWLVLNTSADCISLQSVSGWMLEGLKIDGKYTSVQSVYGVHLRQVNSTNLNSLYVQNVGNASYGGDIGLEGNCYEDVVKYCTCVGGGLGIHIWTSNTYGGDPSYDTVEHCLFKNQLSNGIHVNGNWGTYGKPNHITISYCDIFSAGDCAIEIGSGYPYANKILYCNTYNPVNTNYLVWGGDSDTEIDGCLAVGGSDGYYIGMSPSTWSYVTKFVEVSDSFAINVTGNDGFLAFNSEHVTFSHDVSLRAGWNGFEARISNYTTFDSCESWDSDVLDYTGSGFQIGDGDDSATYKLYYNSVLNCRTGNTAGVTLQNYGVSFKKNALNSTVQDTLFSNLQTNGIYITATCNYTFINNNNFRPCTVTPMNNAGTGTIYGDNLWRDGAYDNIPD